MINKDKLIDTLAEKTGFKKYEAERFLNAFKDVMREYLISGETIKILNLFKAEVKEYKGRIGRNPKTNEPIEIPPHKKVKFTVSEKLNKAINSNVVSE